MPALDAEVLSDALGVLHEVSRRVVLETRVRQGASGAALIEAGARQREDGLWVYRSIPAAQLWDTVMRSAYDFAEPGFAKTVYALAARPLDGGSRTQSVCPAGQDSR